MAEVEEVVVLVVVAAPISLDSQSVLRVHQVAEQEGVAIPAP